MYDLEIKAETDTVKQAILHGYKVRKVTFIGVRGAPDRWFGRKGWSILIEFKREGEVPTKQQLKRHQELREDFGMNVAWTDNYSYACGILRIPC